MSRDPREPLPPDGGPDPDRFERLVASITAAAAPELARRARPGRAASPLLLLGGWARPAMTAAASLAAAAALALALVSAEVETAAAGPVATGLGLETTTEAWLLTGAAPALETLVLPTQETP